MDPLGPNMGKRRGPRGGSLKGTSSTGFGMARAGPLANLHRRLGPSASMSFNSPVRHSKLYIYLVKKRFHSHWK